MKLAKVALVSLVLSFVGSLILYWFSSLIALLLLGLYFSGLAGVGYWLYRRMLTLESNISKSHLDADETKRAEKVRFELEVSMYALGVVCFVSCCFLALYRKSIVVVLRMIKVRIRD